MPAGLDVSLSVCFFSALGQSDENTCGTEQTRYNVPHQISLVSSQGRAAEAGGFIESPRGVWNKETEHVGSSVALGR